MKIADYIEIGNSFKSSVNIDFDLYKSEKLNEYVPTSDICEILKNYLSDFPNNSNRSTFLVGPYGKGKSFLVLALLQIIGKISSKETINNFAKRVGRIDSDLQKQIEKIDSSNEKYLPIIINSDFDNLRQSFIVSLRQTLIANDLTDFVPQSNFDDCLGILDNWMKDPVIANGRLAKCKKNINLDELRGSLEAHSIDGYEKFVSLYNCVSIGQRFNPLVSEDIPKLYSEVANQIKKKGYSGLFVVFDEFSKFLESKSKHLSDDLKFIQDFAEKADRSDENSSMFLCCIAHKPITQYATENYRATDLLKTVEGRFITLRFHRGMKENSELIANAIRKNSDFDSFFEKVLTNKKWMFDESKNLGLLDPNDDFDKFAKGVYPLTPVAACILIKISEMVAQNERTLFTFISSKDVNGLGMLSQKEGTDFIGADAIYDYFREQISLSDDQSIKNVYYLVESSLREQKDLLASKTLKAIALTKIINDSNMIKPTNSIVALALGISPDNVSATVLKLVQAGVVRQSLFDESLDFSFKGGKEINAKADKLLSKELRKVDPIEYLNRLEQGNFYLPNTYNVKHRITRYCRYLYIDYQTFLKLSSFEDLRLDCDIAIIRVVGKQIEEHRVEKIVKSVQNDRVLVEIGSLINCDNLYTLLRYYAAYLKMVGSDDNDVKYEAVSVVIEECENEIQQIIQNSFSDEKARLFSSKELRGKDNAEKISALFENVFSLTPLINNEMLNKNNVTSQYLKARNDVVDYILSGGDFGDDWRHNFSETSPEETIKKIFIDKEGDEKCGISEIITKIELRFCLVSAENTQGKINAREIVKELTAAPYGIRIGVLPLFFAEAIRKSIKNDDMAISLFFHNREIELNASNLGKATQGVTDDYYFNVTKGAKARMQYLAGIVSIVDKDAPLVRRVSLQTALNSLRNWERNLPQITRTATKKEFPKTITDLDESFMGKLSQFDINPSDILFTFLPSIFNSKDYYFIIDQLKTELSHLSRVSNDISNQEFTDLYTAFMIQRGSLLEFLKGKLITINYQRGILIGNRSYCLLADYLFSINKRSDDVLIREMSSYLVGNDFDDWVPGTKATFINELINWTKFIDSSSSNNAQSLSQKVNSVISEQDQTIKSPLITILENQVRADISSFGSSLSEQDVIYALANVIKDIKGVGK